MMTTMHLESIPGFHPFFIESTQSEVDIHIDAQTAMRAERLGPIAGSIIAQTMQNLPLSEKQKNGLDALLNGKAIAMITGQQPGFLGGPLYSLYKAMSCIALAEQHSTDKVPIVPIFWIEDNDHDGMEAGIASIIDQSGSMHTLHCDNMHELQSPIPIHERIFSDHVLSVMETISEQLPNSEFGQAILHQIQEVYTPGKNWSESFLEYMQEHCGEFGLLFFSSSIARKEGCFKERILHEISHAGELQQLVLEKNATLIAKGMKIQAEAGVINAFYHDQHGRHKIDIDESGNVLLASDSVTKDECIDLILAHPEQFSPSVLLRPLIQDSIIPTIGMIVGPGEYGYMSQLEQAYSSLMIPMPQLHGRHSATILIPSIAKYLSKHELEAHFFMRIMNEIERDLSLQFAHDAESDAMIGKLRLMIHEELTAISNHAKSIDSSLLGMVSATEHGIEKLIDGMEKKIISAIKKKQDILFGKASETHAWIYPHNQLQERVLSSVSIEAKIGKEKFRDILNIIKDAPRDKHLLIDVNALP